ncbi:MAG: Do family serine endopeptidase [Rhizobiales bacterium]|nr:Do family serine endopeptidase [Hyphomicrobiales bacterium]
MPRPLSLITAVTIAVAVVAAPALAQERRSPTSASDVRLSYAPIVKRVAPAVVTISAARAVATGNPLFNDPFFRRFFGPGFGMPQERQQRALGSGVIVDASGLIVTNNHVIEGANEVKISLADKRELEVELVLKDSRTDLAILRIKDGRERFPAIELGDSDALEVGDIVLALGNPFGVGQTVTQGIVSAVARTQVGISDYQFFIQTDAAINPGNSGGPLVDMAGKLIGINTAIFSRSGGSMGIGFAIPGNMVKVVVASARDGGAAVRRPWFGGKLQAVTAEIAESIGLGRPTGALVASVTEGSPAARAGLRTGDLIVAIDGVAIDDPNAFEYRFATKSLGGTARLGIVRAGREVALAIPLQTAPETPRDEIVIRARSPFMGAKVANVSPALADQMRIDAASGGVVIVDVADGSPAQSYGFRPGDLILSVNNEDIAKTGDLGRLARGGGRLWRVTIQRGGQKISAVFSG